MKKVYLLLALFLFASVTGFSQKWYGVGKERKTIDFLSKKAVFFAISITVIVVGFVFMGIHKTKGENTLNYSLEFVGGASTNVTFPEDMTIRRV